jgi:hypothetical protein
MVITVFAYSHTIEHIYNTAQGLQKSSIIGVKKQGSINESGLDNIVWKLIYLEILSKGIKTFMYWCNWSVLLEYCT